MESSRSEQELLDAAAREIVQHGYAASSLASIAGRVGLTKGALVRKFPAKQDIAWAIIATLRQVISDERSSSLEVYPQSGIRAMTRFLLGVGVRSASDPQVAAAVVLFTDRASPAFEVAEVLEDWMQALHEFLKVADEQGEVEASSDLQELAEYIFITNMGEAIFGARAYAPTRATRRLRFMRLTLRNSGVRDADAMIDEVLGSFGAGSLGELPARSGLKRPLSR